MICLAILFVLLVAMFLFFRQKMAYYEVRLSLLSDTVQTMAGITRSSLQESDTDSECSESESEYSNEENDTLNTPKIINLNDTPQILHLSEMNLPSLPHVLHLSEMNLPKVEVVSVSEPEPDELIVVSDDETKKIELPTEFDNFSVKELKEKVAELNGPKLKTKKELIQFLQNKI